MGARPVRDALGEGGGRRPRRGRCCAEPGREGEDVRRGSSRPPGVAPARGRAAARLVLQLCRQRGQTSRGEEDGLEQGGCGQKRGGVERMRVLPGVEGRERRRRPSRERSPEPGGEGEGRTPRGGAVPPPSLEEAQGFQRDGAGEDGVVRANALGRLALREAEAEAEAGQGRRARRGDAADVRRKTFLTEEEAGRGRGWAGEWPREGEWARPMGRC